MPRRARYLTAGLIFHVMNRGAKRAVLFETPGDYEAFVRLLSVALDRFTIALFAYCVMQNHWHLLLSPRTDGALSKFMHWLTTTHARRWQSFHQANGQGAVYQGRFKSIPVRDDAHFLWVCRYIERNPVRAGLVSSATDWRWSSAGQRAREIAVPSMTTWPLPMPADWSAYVDAAQTTAEVEAVRQAINKGQPLGDQVWCSEMLRKLGRDPTRRRGRPRRTRPGVLEK
jgi:putative transposase